jgi:hypothetical protein
MTDWQQETMEASFVVHLPDPSELYLETRDFSIKLLANGESSSSTIEQIGGPATDIAIKSIKSE